ncbi:hypothetical protein L1281_001251 [Neisseria sp. HSC-16F19]|nr:DUF6636 domain-containing protein [Neisseria sp. HSC-16F19]MCP2040662.1 hypothetical protein [Neisseria sp. HSC-16F19]
MSKYLFILLAVFAAPAWAGSASIDLSRNFEKVFSTPSGNVLCGGNPRDKHHTALYCLVYHNKAMPKKCQTKGHGLDLTLNAKGKAALRCAGFEFLPENEGEAQTRTLNYGETIRGRGWECRSETTGLTCRNSQGRGFTVNRSRYQLF